MELNLILGCTAGDTHGVHPAYSAAEKGFTAIVNREDICKIGEKAIKLLPEPLFFFLEIPCTLDEEKALGKGKKKPHKNIYYLDNCTAEVCLAILKRYGQLLTDDGLSMFGFGSHNSGEEIYFLKYNELTIFGDKRFEKIFKELNIPREENYTSLWDNFTEETPGECRSVEIDGETVYNIVENLKSEGMYLGDTVED